MREGPVLVTGGLGNLGNTLAHKLLGAGMRVRVLDLDNPPNRRALTALERTAPGRVDGVLGSITSAADVERAMRGVAAVAHLAGILPPASERNPAATQAVNVGGTRALVEAAMAEDPTMPFALASSVSIYGPRNLSTELVSASTPVNPTDAYTQSKVDAENVLRASSLAWIVLRIGASAEGSKLAADKVVLRLMFEVHPDQPIELVHGDDVATAFMNAIRRPEAHRKVFPIGGGPTCRLTQRQLLASTFGLLGVRDLPDAAFGKSPYYTHHMDDSESQRILGHQNHDFAAIEAALAARFGPFLGLIRVFAPITRAILLRLSGPYRGDPPRPTFQDLLESER